MFIENKKIRPLFIFASFLLIPITVILCLGIGRYSLSPLQIVRSFSDALFGGGGDVMARTVIFKVRLPRILLALAAGAGLACAGAAFQGLFSNPLATPDTLGVASGASFGAALAMMFHWNLIGIQNCTVRYNNNAREDRVVVFIMKRSQAVSRPCDGI